MVRIAQILALILLSPVSAHGDVGTYGSISDRPRLDFCDMTLNYDNSLNTDEAIDKFDNCILALPNIPTIHKGDSWKAEFCKAYLEKMQSLIDNLKGQKYIEELNRCTSTVDMLRLRTPIKPYENPQDWPEFYLWYLRAIPE